MRTGEIRGLPIAGGVRISRVRAIAHVAGKDRRNDVARELREIRATVQRHDLRWQPGERGGADPDTAPSAVGLLALEVVGERIPQLEQALTDLFPSRLVHPLR